MFAESVAGWLQPVAAPHVHVLPTPWILVLQGCVRGKDRQDWSRSPHPFETPIPAVNHTTLSGIRRIHMNKGMASVVRGNARDIPLADDSVDLIVTSPPYFALRSYQDGGEHYEGQIGDEPTPTEFVDSLLEVTRECMRVLKPSGSLWVNLGDKYSRGSRPLAQPDQFRDGGEITFEDPKYVKNTASENSGIVGKSLMGIPWRYALRCVDELGLILRAEVMWAKGNGMPESVTGRVRRSHEVWFHFTLSQNYYANLDDLRDPPVNPTKPGRLPGSVWHINTQPLRVPAELNVDHYAAYPTEWPKRIITGWAPLSVCNACNQGRQPRRGTECEGCGGFRPERVKACPGCGHVRVRKSMAERHAEGTPKPMLGGESCGCPDASAPTRLPVVLDPFGGTGTTALVARALGRHGVSLDMSADYCRIADWRTNDEKQLAKVLAVKAPAKGTRPQAPKVIVKPPKAKAERVVLADQPTPVTETQFALFDTLAAATPAPPTPGTPDDTPRGAVLSTSLTDLGGSAA